MELQVTEYSECGSGTSSHRIFCVWNISGSLCNGPNDTSAQGPLGQSHLGGAVIYCSILAVDPTEIFCVFSQILSCSNKYYQAVTNQLTYDKDPDIKHTSWPKAAGTKLPKGPTRQSEGEFSTL